MKATGIPKRYKKIYKPDHPHAMSCGCVYEHRLIMEQMMGRYLLPTEQVHHRDEDKTNNDPKNLVFCPTQKDHSAEHGYNKEQLIDLLIRYADIYGNIPSKAECDRNSQLPHSSTYRRHFGSWLQARNQAQAHLDGMNIESYY